MVLNYIWIAFFLIAFVFALVQWIFMGDMEIFPALTQATFDNAKLGFEISLWLTGVMSLWLGIMKIGEKGGMVSILAKITSPLFSRLFPEVPKNHPAMGAMLMNISANMLGLDNAATPLGLKAMHSLQELNPKKDTASNAQIMFLVLNTSGLTIIPISIMVYRSQLGAADPSDVFIPILLTTFFSTLSGLIAVSIVQRINLFHKNILLSLGLLSLIIASIIYFFSNLSQAEIGPISSNIANFILFSIIIAFIVLAVRKKVNVYDSFVEGAKEGFNYAIMIIPYLIAILVAVGVFRASGAMDLLKDGLEAMVAFVGLNTDFVPSIPTALMKPLSGSGARGMMVDAMEVHGADSFVGRLVSVMQGSTETTFYVLAVYFGSVNIRNSRYALTCGLIADAVGIVAAILISYMFFY
ncbi:spore maturation protein [Marivirga harenae]|uniref:nucleoside recognition domain-containing protein n=1 Tax=Marivirga harenae TaxID=2010992 RepID=UPI0026E0F647|nr:spore maturation protein [Marivirga harenae]WKV12046.1 nucleoside recognition domain-containing protein [Marivirga harenae]|tara:strand:+ start:152558 stop:153790 length:1233 start_codon:yes stop_codon:yes gene_type:complete